MKKNLLRYALIAVIFSQSLVCLLSQDDNPIDPVQNKKPFYVGPVIGYNKVMHSVTLGTPNPGATLCPSFNNGSSNGFFAGVSAEFLLGGVKDSKSSIIVRLLYNTFPAKMEQQSIEKSLPSVDDKGNQVKTDVLYTNKIGYNTLDLDLAYKFNFMDHLGVVAGPSIGYVMTATQDMRMNLIADPSISFKQETDPNVLKDLGIRYTDFINTQNNTGARTIVMREGNIPNKQSLRIAMKVGLQYEIITKSNMYVVPSIAYNFGITNLNDQSWRVSAIQIGVDIRFAIK